MGYKEDSAAYRKAWKGEVAGHAGDPQYIDYSKLVSIGSGGKYRRVIAPCYQAWNKMRLATLDRGWSFEVGPSTFRIYSEEVALCQKRVCDGKSKARPGCSRHGWGRAIDFSVLYSAVNGKLNVLPPSGTQARAFFDWLCNNAIKYGFVNYLAECWHWEFVGVPPGVYDNPACTNTSGEYDGGTGDENSIDDFSGSGYIDGSSAPPGKSYSEFFSEINGGISTTEKIAELPQKEGQTNTGEEKTNEFTEVKTISNPTTKLDVMSVSKELDGAKK